MLWFVRGIMVGLLVVVKKLELLLVGLALRGARFKLLGNFELRHLLVTAARRGWAGLAHSESTAASDLTIDISMSKAPA